jgi:hypothetical protein
MSLSGKILDKLGFGGAKAETTPLPPAKAPPASPAPVPRAAAAAPAAPVAIPVVDVVARLEALAAANPQKLNWRVSIVDLLKLLGLESSFTARKDLATELECPPRCNARLSQHEHVAAQDRVEETRGQRRQHPEGPARLNDECRGPCLD